MMRCNAFIKTFARNKVRNQIIARCDEYGIEHPKYIMEMDLEELYTLEEIIENTIRGVEKYGRKADTPTEQR